MKKILLLTFLLSSSTLFAQTKEQTIQFIKDKFALIDRSFSITSTGLITISTQIQHPKDMGTDKHDTRMDLFDIKTVYFTQGADNHGAKSPRLETRCYKGKCIRYKYKNSTEVGAIEYFVSYFTLTDIKQLLKAFKHLKTFYKPLFSE